MHFLSWQFLCRQCNFQKSKRGGKFRRSFNTWKHRTISAYSDTLNPHISYLFKAQLVVHWSTRHAFLSPSLSVLIHCSVNQLWSEYFYSSPSCWFHSLNQKCSLNLCFHTPGSRAVRRLSWFPSLIHSPVQSMNPISLSFQTLSLPVCLALTHTELWALLGAVLNYSSSHVT